MALPALRSISSFTNKGRPRHLWAFLAAVILSLVGSGDGWGKEASASERSAPLIPTMTARLDDIRITVFYDNIRFRLGPTPDWGFSCLVEGAGLPILFDTDGGLIVICGCAHPGIVEMVSRAKSVSAKEILLVMGGFHLQDYTPPAIQKIIAAFKTLGVGFVAPSHCTGIPARRLFQEQYGANFIESGVGKVIWGKDLGR